MASAKKAGKTLADFRAQFDRDVITTNKIKATFEEMLKVGPEEYETESDFFKLAGISVNDIKNLRDTFAPHIVEMPALKRERAPIRVWFADAKVAEKARPKKVIRG